jgi:hypothetical protein
MILLKTSILLLCPIIAFQSRIREPSEWILAILVIMVIITSQLFWSNPIRNGWSHKIDSYVTKITIFIFIFYTFYKGFSTLYWKWSYIIIIFMMAFSFYLSNYYSSKKWLCDQHILSHILVHYWGLIGSLYAFF